MNKGFTLIELLVAITIGMLVVGFGSVSLNNFYENQKVDVVKQELISNLRLARSYAITNQFPSDSSADTDRVAVLIDDNGLMTVGTQTSGNVDTGYTFFSKDVTPKGVGVTFYGPNETNIIRFSVTDGRSIGGTASIIINGVNINKNIKVDESGLIYEE